MEMNYNQDRQGGGGFVVGEFRRRASLSHRPHHISFLYHYIFILCCFSCLLKKAYDMGGNKIIFR